MDPLHCAVAALALLACLATAAELPACPVAPTLKAPAHPVTAGRVITIKLAVKGEGLGWGQLRNLSVAINLPSNVCLKKSSVRPSLKRSTTPTPKAPIVEGQNVYWLDVPFAGGTKGASPRRTFSLNVRVSSLYTTAATVPITAMVYAVDDDTGVATCVTTAEPAASVRCGICGGVGRCHFGAGGMRETRKLALVPHLSDAMTTRQNSCGSCPPIARRKSSPRPPWSAFAPRTAAAEAAAIRE